MDDNQVKEAQRQFFKRNLSGCAFAAYAAKQPEKYGWLTVVLSADPDEISATLVEAIADPAVHALSMIFPSVQTTEALVGLANACVKTDHFFNEAPEDTGVRFIKLRARVGEDVSWVTGFGPFDFLPKTRQAPYCELTIRVKPRPKYDWYFKETADGVIHLADLDMRGMSDRNLKKLWLASFERTKQILGHPPDEESAAKTTFVIPL